MPSKADDDLFGESSSDEELAPVAKKGKDENKAAAGKKSSEFAGYLSWPAGRTLERGFYISYVVLSLTKHGPTGIRSSTCVTSPHTPAAASLAMFDSSDEDEEDFVDAGAKDPADDSEDEAAGLFDSDDSDDDGEAAKKKAREERRKKKKLTKKKKEKSDGGKEKSDGGKKKKKKKKKRKRGSADSDDDDDGGSRPLSKRERMEALRARKRSERGGGAGGEVQGDSEGEKKEAADGTAARGDEGYDSGDSYGAENFVRTKEDDDFIDAEGEDPDALRELYAEQHFDDERGEGTDSEDERDRRKKGRGGKKKKPGPDDLSDEDLSGDEVPDNPIMAAVHKMKKKKKKPKKLSELEDEAKEFLGLMQSAAEEDLEAIKARKPATKKLAMLNKVVYMLTRKDMMRPLLDLDLLVVAGTWAKPLPNGKLGNVTVRSKLLQAIGKMQGENGVTAHDLKRSNFGKVIMSLYMHKSETPELKRQHKDLIEQWSRPIFNKSGNMRDLERAQERRVATSSGRGVAAFARAQARTKAAGGDRGATAAAPAGGSGGRDLGSIIARGTTTTRDLGNNRVRVPYSKGFQYSVRPSDRVGNVQDNRTYGVTVKDSREGLHKKMLDKGRPMAKNQRSSNMSIEGRPTK